MQWDLKNTEDKPERRQKQTIDIENQCICWQCMTGNTEDIKSFIKIYQKPGTFKSGRSIIQEKCKRKLLMRLARSKGSVNIFSLHSEKKAD